MELLLDEDHAFPLLHKLYLLGLSGRQCAGRAQRALAGEGVFLLRLQVFIELGGHLGVLHGDY